MRKRKVWAKGTIEERSRRLPDNQMTNLSSKCQGPGITIRPMSILIIEDDEKLVDQLVRGLVDEGFAVDFALDGISGLNKAATQDFDVIILDGILPGIDGLAVLAALRQSKQTAVLMLTARDSVEDRVTGLKSGADDYMVKPFAFSELVARIKVLLRRNPSLSGAANVATILRMHDLEIDLARQRAFRAGKRLDLSAKEYSLLILLMRRQGQVISRAELAAQVWSINFEADSNVVEVAIRRLRMKIDEPFDKPLLHTIRGMGYILESR